MIKQFLTFLFLSVCIGCAPLTEPISQPLPAPKVPEDQTPVERPQKSTKKLFDLNDIPTTPVRYKSKVQPVYQETARLAKKGGEVIIQLTVDENGMPIDIKPLTNLGYGLEECVIEAVKKTTFYPAKYGNKPVAKRIEVKYRFSYETTEDE